MHALILNQIIDDSKVKQTNKWATTDFQWINTSVCLLFQTFMTYVEYTMTFEESKSSTKKKNSTLRARLQKLFWKSIQDYLFIYNKTWRRH